MDSLEQGLRRLEDERAITRVLYDYAAALDARDADAYVALFAKDGEWINGRMVRKGADDIRALVEGLFGDTPADFVNRESFELVLNPRIDVEGDRARVRCAHVLFRRGPDASPLPALFGRYEDEFVREDGEWKILRRIDYPTIPTSEEWGRMMRERQQRA